MQQRRVRLNRRQLFVEMQLRRNRRTPHRAELRFEKFHHAAHHIIQVHGRQFRLRHFREIAEPADDVFQVLDFRKQDSRRFAKHFFELLGILFLRALQIFDRRLQREQRILQFVRQPPRHFAPGRHALGLHQPLALLDQLLRHLIERRAKLADFVSRRARPRRAFQFPADTSRAPSASLRTGRVTRAAPHQLNSSC